MIMMQLCTAFNLSALFAGTSIAAENIPYSTWMLDSVISRGEGVEAADGLLSGIQKGIFQEAVRAAIEQSQDLTQKAAWSEYHQKSLMYNIDEFANATADSLAPLDRLCAGVSILQSGLDNGPSQKALEGLRKSLDLQNRNKNGGWWYYTDPPPPYVPYGNLSYNDGMYGVAPFTILYGQRHPSDKSMGIATALEQLKVLYDHSKHATGLIVHGYDGSKQAPWANTATGASPAVWGRSMAWYMIGALNALEIAAKEESTYTSGEYARIESIFRSLAYANVAALQRSAEKTSRYGVWQVADRPGDADNFIEASASAMMVYVLAKGVRLGHLDPKYQPEDSSMFHEDLKKRHLAVQRPYDASDNLQKIIHSLYDEVVDSFVVTTTKAKLEFHGTSAISSLHQKTPYYKYYINRPQTDDSLIGESAFILASLELERAGRI